MRSPWPKAPNGSPGDARWMVDPRDRAWRQVHRSVISVCAGGRLPYRGQDPAEDLPTARYRFSEIRFVPTSLRLRTFSAIAVATGNLNNTQSVHGELLPARGVHAHELGSFCGRDPHISSAFRPARNYAMSHMKGQCRPNTDKIGERFRTAGGLRPGRCGKPKIRGLSRNIR